jgi:dual specificity tyrosine-phosphorylation-regulated kinase 2/3/4
MSTAHIDSTGNPRPFVNSKGKRRRPGAKSLPQVLKCEDDQFVDFISKCLIWDPERRLKPNAAMSHPWITSGRRSRLVSPAPGSVSSRLSSGAVNSPSASRTRSIHQDALKDRIISGPSPLVARRTVQGTTLTSTSNGSTEPGTKPRHGQYNVSRGIVSDCAGRFRNDSSSSRMLSLQAA